MVIPMKKRQDNTPKINETQEEAFGTVHHTSMAFELKSTASKNSVLLILFLTQTVKKVKFLCLNFLVCSGKTEYAYTCDVYKVNI